MRPSITSLALPLTAGVLVGAAAGVVGWLASQPPLPEPLPYEVAVPAPPEAEATEAETEAGISLAARSLPVTFELLEAWIPRLEDEGISLAPLTAVSARQALG